MMAAMITSVIKVDHARRSRINLVMEVLYNIFMKLSLCIATYNEEKFIHYPLDSAYDLVDEVIIVDGGSKDKTVEIAEKYGDKVKVFHEDNPPMFHINKQKALEKAKGEWILQLDADEALSEELKSEIKEVVRNRSSFVSELAPKGAQTSTQLTQTDYLTPDDLVAYWIPRKNFFLNRFLMKGGVYPDYTIRLYKNGKAKFPCESVHENVKVNGEVGYLKSQLLHFADPEFKRYLKRWQRYTSLDADMLIKEKKNINFFDYILVKPTFWFLKTYVRHKGFMDGFAGFVFSFFSSIRFWVIYFKWLKRR